MVRRTNNKLWWFVDAEGVHNVNATLEFGTAFTYYVPQFGLFAAEGLRIFREETDARRKFAELSSLPVSGAPGEEP